MAAFPKRIVSLSPSQTHCNQWSYDISYLNAAFKCSSVKINMVDCVRLTQGRISANRTVCQQTWMGLVKCDVTFYGFYERLVLRHCLWFMGIKQKSGWIFLSIWWLCVHIQTTCKSEFCIVMQVGGEKWLSLWVHHSMAASKIAHFPTIL